MLPLLPQRNSEENWIVDVNNNLKCMPADEQQYWKYPSIYRVPAFIIDLHCKAYQPQVVSFGPYHHGEDHLHPMEKHKHRTLLHFLKRSGKTIEPFFESLWKVVHKLEDSYDELDPKWKDGAGGPFLELMITDGCFMLEIMRTATMEKNDYADNDPIFSIHRLKYMVPHIGRDMLLLENQLPMLVLYRLVDVESNGEEDDVVNKLNKLILNFYGPLEGKKKYYPHKGLKGCLHVLDVFRKGLLLEPEKDHHEQENEGLEAAEETVGSAPEETEPLIQSATQLIELVNGDPEAGEEIIRSATELSEAGIRFKNNKTNKSLKNISFDKGTLNLPVITVDDTTKSKFLNAMTFEQLHIGTQNEVTSYVTFMDQIINNEDDVALLHAKGIIQNDFGSDTAVAKLFNSLCREVTLPSDSSLNAVQKSINEYCNKRRNKWRAYLTREYFKNPWTILSLFAAIFLFVLTIIQAVYAVLSYY